MRFFFVLCAFYFALLSSAVVNAQTTQQSMLSLRVVGDDNFSRLIAVFDRRPDYVLQMLSNPERLVVNLDATQFVAPKNAISAHALIANLRYGATSATHSRIVLGVDGPFVASDGKIQKLDDGLWQLVIDVTKSSKDAFKKAMAVQWEGYKTQTHENPQKILHPLRVVIDPGHGGIDGGAQGVSGVLEKNVTLAFARSLRDSLERFPGIQVLLTRDSDMFLRLGERVSKAHYYNADLFISIHADTIAAPDLRGATVYTLSDKASDNVARILAESENRADLIGGLPSYEAPGVANILIDLTRRETYAFSAAYARKVVDTLLENNINLIKTPHRYAGFEVLKAADIPSVLIELGYLSNIEDEKLITNPQWRQKVADALAHSVQKFADYRADRLD